MTYYRIAERVHEANPNKHKFELSNAQIAHLQHAADAALALIALAGTATIAVVAPNLLQAVGKVLPRKYPGRRFPQKEKELRVAKTFYYLRRKGYVSFKPDVHDIKLFLTEKGRGRLAGLNIKCLTAVAKTRGWNGRWWQVAADIPTHDYRLAADALRRKLKQMRFYPLQRSLWFYPFDPRKEINLLTAGYHVAEFVTVMEIARLDKEDEAKLKSYFKAQGIL